MKLITDLLKKLTCSFVLYNYDCIINIAYRHFTPGRTLQVSLSSNDGDFTLILSNLHNLLLFPLQLSISDSVPEDLMFEDIVLHQSYIIFASSNIPNVLEDIKNQIDELQLTPRWNSRAKFLTVMPLTSTRELVQRVAEDLWKSYKISNIVIMVGNDLFTWVLYKSYDTCSQVEVFLVDRCLQMEDKLHQYASNKSLFLNKKTLNFLGCPVRVTPIETTRGMVYQEKIGDKSKYTGVEIEYFNLFADILNLSVEYYPADREANGYDKGIKALGDVSDGIVDVIFGSMPIHPIAMGFAEPSITFLDESARWHIPCGKPHNRMERVAGIFSISVWITLIISFVLMALTLFKLAKMATGESLAYSSLSKCFYAVSAVAIGISVPEMPVNWRTRLLFLVFVWYCFVMNMLFQIFFTSFLVNPGRNAPIQNTEELYASELVYFYNKGMEEFLKQSITDYYNKIPLKKRMCEMEESCVKDYFMNPNAVTIAFDLHDELTVLAYVPPHERVPGTCALNENILKVLYALYFEKGSLFLPAFNLVIRRAMESGLLEKLTQDVKQELKYYDWSTENSSISLEFNEDQNYFVFGLRHLQIAFYIHCIGCLLAFACFTQEICTFRKKCGNMNRK